MKTNWGNPLGACTISVVRHNVKKLNVRSGYAWHNALNNASRAANRTANRWALLIGDTRQYAISAGENMRASWASE